MCNRYVVRVEVWPHSSGRGREVDQAQAGPRERRFEVKATDMRDAIEKADLLVAGIMTNPVVWQAPVKEVRELGHGEDVREDRDEWERAKEDAFRFVMPSSLRGSQDGLGATAAA